MYVCDDVDAQTVELFAGTGSVGFANGAATTTATFTSLGDCAVSQTGATVFVVDDVNIS